MVYTDLEIRILELTPQGYPVEITLNHKQQYTGGYLSTDFLSWTPSASPTADGEQLFNRLLADDRLKMAWAEVRGQSPQRRIRLRLDENAPELHTIPWELLRDTSPGLTPQPLAADADTPFSRYLPGQWSPGSAILDRPIKLLVAIANPTNLADYNDLTPLNVRAERLLITEAVSDLPAGQLDLTFLKAPVTLAALETELRRGYHLLHLVGHGQSRKRNAVLFLANDDNQVERVSETDLAELLERQQKSLRLVFLAACQTATHSPAEVFRGFAPRLVAAGVPAVVAMQDVVPMDTARDFTHTFYQQLLQHGQVDLAANEGRSALLAGRDDSWAVPVLYSRVPEGIIIEPSAISPPPTVWERFRQLPLVARTVAIGSALLGVIGVFAMLIGLSLDLPAARQPGGLLASVWPAPTATATLTATATPTSTPTATATPTPIPTMPGKGFNIAVAQFAALDNATGPPVPVEASQELSGWLFDSVEDAMKGFSPSLRDEVWGPDKVKPVPGQDVNTRDANATQLATQINASLLIYGVITRSHTSNEYYVQPEFYITEDEVGFPYGSEVVGVNRLGQPITFTLPLNPATLEDTNKNLYARSQALQEIISGLADFYINHHGEAYNQFERAAEILEGGGNDECKEDETGREVVYLLMGAAKLRAYRDSEPHSDESILALNQALEAFTCAAEVNPDYARSYLGLGSIALQQATVQYTEWPTRVDKAKLIEAEDWYLKSLSTSDQPASAYVPVKAAYGLGQIHLAGYPYDPRWSKAQSDRYFNQVIEAYRGELTSSIVWFAGRAHANLAWLAKSDGLPTVVLSECQQTIELLSQLPVNRPDNLIAYCWAWIASVEEERKNLNEAHSAYLRAIQLGQESNIPPENLGDWQQALDRLEK